MRNLINHAHRSLPARIRFLVLVCLAAVVGLVVVNPVTELLAKCWIVARSKTGICGHREAFEAIELSAVQRAGASDMFAQMKLLKTDAAGYELWQTPIGQLWMAAGSRAALAYDLAEQHRNIYGTKGRGVKPGDTVLDCGANIGVYTKKALAEGAKLVVAIEPAPENLECLRRNLASEISRKQVIIYPKGVWDKDDVLAMHISGKNSAADSFVRSWGGNVHDLLLPLTTIDQLVQELKLERVDFVKMDIEGAERQALKGATKTIRRFRPRMALAFYHLPDDPVRIPEAVRSIEPAYDLQCQCMDYANYNIGPEVGFFQPL